MSSEKATVDRPSTDKDNEYLSNVNTNDDVAPEIIGTYTLARWNSSAISFNAVIQVVNLPIYRPATIPVRLSSAPSWPSASQICPTTQAML